MDELHTAASPPGPLPDPSGHHELRWWDGTFWTDQVCDAGRWSYDPMSAPLVVDSPTPATGWRRFRSLPGLVQGTASAAGLVFVIGLVGAAAGGEDRPVRLNADATTTTTTDAAAAPTAPTTARPRATPPPTTVPPTTPAPTTTRPTTTAAPPPATTAQDRPALGPDCNPNYDPCVPNASDVDCAGGEGDGPEYVEGPVDVDGSDPYDLDHDGNGTGCER